MNFKKVQHIIHLTDIHGQIDPISEIGEELRQADIVILSGDITHFGREKNIRQIIDAVGYYNSSIFTVSGNCDYPEIENYLSEIDISLHLKIRKFSGFIFTGISGSIPCPGTTPFEYTEDQASDWLQPITRKLTGKSPVILVSHQPPINTITDRLPSGLHVGSKSIYNFILTIQPVICLTGHIHEGIGHDLIGKTKVINPGSFRSGRYAKIKIEDERSVDIQLKQITALR